MRDTLNYWLGKLARLQLFGHGIKQIRVSHEGSETMFDITNVIVVDDIVYIEIK